MGNVSKKSASRQDIISRLLFRPTFFSGKDLYKYADDLIVFLDHEDSHLEKTGFPSRQFDHWYSPFGSWQNLYFTKIPYESILAGAVPAKIWKEALEKRNPSIVKRRVDEVKQSKDTAYAWLKRPPSSLGISPEFVHASSEALTKLEIPFAQTDYHFRNFGYWLATDGTLLDDGGREVRRVSFAEAKRFSWIGGDQANQIEQIRPRLFQSKLRTLEYIIEFLKSGGDAKSKKSIDAFLEDVANVLVEEVGSDALGFCSKVEEQYLSNYIFNCGGVTAILRTVGLLCESLKTYSEIAKRLSEFRDSSEGDYPTYNYGKIPDALLHEVNAAHIRCRQIQEQTSFLAVEKIERIIEGSRKTKVVKSARKNQSLIPKHRTFQWSKVRISIKDVELLSVEYRGVQYELSYEQLGLFDKKTGKPNHAWLIMQKIIVRKGVLDTSEQYTEEKSLRQQIMKVRVALKRIFGTNSDPFDSNVKFKGAYVAKFLTGGIPDAFIQMLKSEVANESERSFWQMQTMDTGHGFNRT